LDALPWSVLLLHLWRFLLENANTPQWISAGCTTGERLVAFFLFSLVFISFSESRSRRFASPCSAIQAKSLTSQHNLNYSPNQIPCSAMAEEEVVVGVQLDPKDMTQVAYENEAIKQRQSVLEQVRWSLLHGVKGFRVTFLPIVFNCVFFSSSSPKPPSALSQTADTSQRQ
jgi:hypothetical protein